MSITFSIEALTRHGIHEVVRVAVGFKDKRVRQSSLLSIFQAAVSTNIPIEQEIAAYATIPIEEERVMILSKIFERVKFMGPREMDNHIATARSLGVSSSDISLILMRFGHIAVAIQKANLIPNERERTDALWTISRGLMLRGKVSWAFQVALMIPDTIKIKIRDRATRAVRYERAQEVAFRKLIETVEIIEDALTKRPILQKISEVLKKFIFDRHRLAFALGAQGEAVIAATNEAALTAEKIPDKEIQRVAFLGLAQALLQLGYIDEAIRLSSLISDIEGRRSLLQSISETLKTSVVLHISNLSGRSREAVATLINNAIFTAKKIPVQEIQTSTFVDMAIVLLRQGYINEPLSLKKHIPEGEMREFFFREVSTSLQLFILERTSQLLSWRGPKEELLAALMEAYELVEKIPNIEMRDTPLLDISKALKRIGRVGRAAYIAEKISDKDLRWTTILDILQGLIQSGHLKEASSIAKKISDPELRASALLLISSQTTY